jgi:hypothetical protein
MLRAWLQWTHNFPVGSCRDMAIQSYPSSKINVVSGRGYVWRQIVRHSCSPLAEDCRFQKRGPR